MATVGFELAHKIAQADGYYMDDPRVVRIVEYTDMGGKLAYGLEYEHHGGNIANRLRAQSHDLLVRWKGLGHEPIN